MGIAMNLTQPDWSFDDRRVQKAKMEAELVILQQLYEHYRQTVTDIFHVAETGERIDLEYTTGETIALMPQREPKE